MIEAKTPCSANPDQWYTERDGRRYDDELLISQEQIDEIAATLPEGEPGRPTIEAFDKAVDEATDEVVRKRLIERRQAREACFACPVRLVCLDIALSRREQYGIWGGYFPEQRRAIERELDRRAELAEAAASGE